MTTQRLTDTDTSPHSLLEFNPTGDAELDALKKQQIEKELERIQRNADRRTAREKQKGRMAAPAANTDTGSPGGGPSNSEADGTPQKGGAAGNAAGGGGGGRGRNKDGTARKCANCGQVGHIKTNRKSVSFRCPFCLSEACDPMPVTAEGGKGKGKGKKGQERRDSVQESAGSAALSTYSRFQL